jgi:flagellar basal-body rod protein FlgB
MIIDGVTNGDALPVLERLMQFAGQRHRLIAGNIANLSTPGYQPVDLSVEGFRSQLAEAIETRRARFGNTGGHLELRDTAELRFHDRGIAARPSPVDENILFHDGNDRDLERTMQQLVENFMTFRAAAQLMRQQLDTINVAIRERV